MRMSRKGSFDVSDSIVNLIYSWGLLTVVWNAFKSFSLSVQNVKQSSRYLFHVFLCRLWSFHQMYLKVGFYKHSLNEFYLFLYAENFTNVGIANQALPALALTSYNNIKAVAMECASVPATGNILYIGYGVARRGKVEGHKFLTRKVKSKIKTS